MEYLNLNINQKINAKGFDQNQAIRFTGNKACRNRVAAFYYGLCGLNKNTYGRLVMFSGRYGKIIQY